MDEAFHLFQINRTVLELLQARGYRVPQALVNLSFDAFKQTYGDRPERKTLSQCYTKADDATDQIMVFYDATADGKVGVPSIQEYYKQMKSADAERALLIYKEITPWAKQCIAKLKITMEQWKEQELLINITKHNYVPQHEVLTDEQKLELLRRYKLKETQLPRIQVDDPVARYLGLTRGKVVKITRPSETAGRYVTYRYVV